MIKGTLLHLFALFDPFLAFGRRQILDLILKDFVGCRIRDVEKLNFVSSNQS